MTPDGNKMGEMAVQWARAQPVVTNYLRSVVNNYHDAEDIVQKVAYAAASRYDEFDPSRPFTGWVLGIAKFKVLEYRRGINQDRHVFGEKALERIGHVYGEVNSEQMHARHEALEICMSKLTKRARQVLQLRYNHELKPASIAEQLGATANAVCLLLSRTRKALAKCIKQQSQQVEG